MASHLTCPSPSTNFQFSVISFYMKRFTLLINIAIFSIGANLSNATPPSDQTVNYREFTNTKGQKIKAVLIDKNETKAVFLLSTGKRTTVPINSLSKDDQAFVKNWNKAKAFFLQKCTGLTIGELLTLRGYEAIPIKFEGNSMLIHAKINGKPAKFIVDTGAGSSLFDTAAMKRTDCNLGEFTEKVYGVSGEAPAAWAEVNETCSRKNQMALQLTTHQKLEPEITAIGFLKPKIKKYIGAPSLIRQPPL